MTLAPLRARVQTIRSDEDVRTCGDALAAWLTLLFAQGERPSPPLDAYEWHVALQVSPELADVLPADLAWAVVQAFGWPGHCAPEDVLSTEAWRRLRARVGLPPP